MRIRDFIYEEDGVGVVEVILILVVLIALVLLFKEQITAVVTKVLAQIATDSDAVMSK